MVKLVRILTLMAAVAITVASVFYIDSGGELAKARQAYESGDMDQALRMARRANFASSEDNIKVAAFYLQARAASKMNWDKKAISYLDHLLSIDENNIPALLFRGELEYKFGKNQDALRDLNKGLKAAPFDMPSGTKAYYLSKRGLVNLALELSGNAEKDAVDAIKLAEELAEAHDLMSKVYEEKGEIKRALEECELAFKLAIEKNKLSFMTPEGRKLSDRLVRLRGKYLMSE